MTHWPLARFVTAIGSHTVRLDLNDGTLRIGEETKAEAFGQPDWEAEPGDTGGVDGYRTTSLQVLCGRSKPEAARAYHRLALELQRPSNVILWQDSPESQPRWIRVWRSQLPVLSQEWVTVVDHPDGGEDVWQTTLALASDPYAYGEPVTLRRTILNRPDARAIAPVAVNLLPNPSFETTSAGWAGGVRRQSLDAVAGDWRYELNTDVVNLIPDGSAESGSPDSWRIGSASGEPPTVVIGDTADLHMHGSWSAFVTPGGASSWVRPVGPSGAELFAAPAAGTRLRQRVTTSVLFGAANSFSLAFAFFDSTGAEVSRSQATTSTIPGSFHQTFVRLENATTVPAGAASWAPVLSMDVEGEDNLVLVDEWIAVADAELPEEFFDGDSPGASWAGIPYRSESILAPETWTWGSVILGDAILPDASGGTDPDYTFSATCGDTNYTITPEITWLDAGGEAIATDTGESAAITAATRVHLTATRPAAATRARVALHGEIADALGFGAWCDAMMFAAGTSTEFRDGDSPGWGWTGRPGESTSGPVDPVTGRPAHAVLTAGEILGDGPADTVIRITPTTPWHVIEPLIQITALESPAETPAPIVLALGDADASSGFETRSGGLRWIDFAEHITWESLDPSLTWEDL